MFLSPALSSGTVEWLRPVVEIREPVGEFLQVGVLDIVIAGRGEEQGRTQERGADVRRGGLGVVDRPVFLAILGDPAPVVDDVAGDHDEVGLGTIGLIRHGLLTRGVGPAIAEDDETMRLFGPLPRLGPRREDRRTRLAHPVFDRLPRFQAGERRPVDPMGRDLPHGNPLHHGSRGALPGRVVPAPIVERPGGVRVVGMPEHLECLGRRRRRGVAELDVRFDHEDLLLRGRGGSGRLLTADGRLLRGDRERGQGEREGEREQTWQGPHSVEAPAWGLAVDAIDSWRDCGRWGVGECPTISDRRCQASTWPGLRTTRTLPSSGPGVE